MIPAEARQENQVHDRFQRVIHRPAVMDAASPPDNREFLLLAANPFPLSVAHQCRYWFRTSERSFPLYRAPARPGLETCEKCAGRAKGKVIFKWLSRLNTFYISPSLRAAALDRAQTANPSLSSGRTLCLCIHTSDGCTSRRFHRDRPSRPVVESSRPARELLFAGFDLLTGAHLVGDVDSAGKDSVGAAIRTTMRLVDKIEKGVSFFAGWTTPQSRLQLSSNKRDPGSVDLIHPR